MAARRLAFEKLYETFHSSHTFKDAFDEGRAWPVAPFLNTLIPLVKAADSERARLVPLLRANSPLLRDGSLSAANTRDRLRSLAAGVEQLAAIVRSGGNASIEKALRTANEAQLLELDERLAGFFTEDERPSFSEELPDDAVETVRQFLACDVHQIQGYFEYIDRESHYSTPARLPVVGLRCELHLERHFLGPHFIPFALQALPCFPDRLGPVGSLQVAVVAAVVLL
jgi:DNA helicase II / ATP-dependent DNA helicase PcrA